MQLYAKVKDSARYCRDLEVRKKINLFLEVIKVGEADLACKRFGVHRSSYYRWWSRFKKSGYHWESLIPKSRRPKHSPSRIKSSVIRKIKEYRFAYRYGPKRIAYFLWVNHKIKVSESTIRREILRQGWILKRYRTKQQNPHKKRYELPVPGMRVQVDIKYVPKRVGGEKCYVYNAIDECSRWRFAQAYWAINADNAVDFVLDLIAAAPFEIQCIQTDNDIAFTNRFHFSYLEVQHPFEALLEGFGIRHRLLPPGAKELNGKVERSHRIDEDEFYWKASYDCLDVFQTDLSRWIQAYNGSRPHGSLGNLTPMEKILEKTLLPLMALAIHYKTLTPPQSKIKLKLGFRTDTYLKYLDWVQMDPFHFSDVRNFYRWESKKLLVE